ncbi:hypothetical protein E5D57_003968 [Metarhizium anisopliae]|nr:hypothetical protein E5D57_003968 [Metarhizium anisopliae]
MESSRLNKPKHVYKITTSTPPDPIPAVYPPSELDQTDGFIHLSTAAQGCTELVPKTADMFFSHVLQLWVVKIQLDKLTEHRIHWEGDGCVHLYGDFGAQDVVAVEKCVRQGESWSDCLQDATWLI